MNKMKVFFVIGLALSTSLMNTKANAHLNTEKVEKIEQMGKICALYATAATAVDFFAEKNEKDSLKTLVALGKVADQFQLWTGAAVEGSESIMRLKRLIALKEDKSFQEISSEKLVHQLVLMFTAYLVKEVGHDGSEILLRKMVPSDSYKHRLARRAMRVVMEALIEALVDGTKAFGEKQLCSLKKNITNAYLDTFIQNLGASAINEIGGELFRQGLEEEDLELEEEIVESVSVAPSNSEEAVAVVAANVEENVQQVEQVQPVQEVALPILDSASQI